VSRVNGGKLIAGGILAGVVMNICDYVSNNFILATDWEHIARIRNVDLADMSSTSALVIYVGVDMLLGLLVVWTYAASGRGSARDRARPSSRASWYFSRKRSSWRAMPCRF
jgi:hypothetical protein